MKRSTSIILLFVLFAGVQYSCQKETHSSLYPKGNQPDVVKGITVENLPGAAKITYSLPNDNNILSVTAKYEIRPGVKREVTASYYNTFLIADGFGDTLEHEVTLVVTNRSDITSDPVRIKVKPLTPPVVSVFRSLVINTDFGGITVGFTNPTKADMAIYVRTPDATGVMAEAKVNYTKLEAGSFPLRGYDSAQRKFSFYVVDRFGNVSDTLTNFYKPLYEKMLDKTLFREVKLPGDMGDDWGLPMPNMWDGSIDGWSMWHSQTKPFPMWISFELGLKVKLSRITLWHRQDDGSQWIYNQNNPKKFEIRGSNNPDTDGGWNNWTKLISHEVVKPSMLPMGQISQDDVDAARRGEEMTVPLDMPAVRYLRIKILETYTNSACNIAEVSVWGQP